MHLTAVLLLLTSCGSQQAQVSQVSPLYVIQWIGDYAASPRARFEGPQIKVVEDDIHQWEADPLTPLDKLTEDWNALDGLDDQLIRHQVRMI